MKLPDNLFRRQDPPYQAETFKRFILADNTRRKYLLMALAGMVVQFILFKLAYPFGDYFSDSYSYIYAAANHFDFNIWPVGYSKFIYIVHLFTHSDTALVGIQYAATIIAGLLFFYTILYWFTPSKTVTQVLYVFLFFNPLTLYVCNYISSDGIFMAMSLTWFSLLLWIIFKPNLWFIFAHALLLGIAFPVRYNAMYYPIVAGFAFLLSRYSIPLKLTGIVLPLVFIGIFIMYTRDVAEDMTGSKQFSAFSGWQWANNALYMYPHIEVDEATLPAGTAVFHNMVKHYFDTIPENMAQVSPLAGSFYIKYPYAPLKQYYAIYVRDHQPRDNIAAWGGVAPVFSAYGTHLVKQNPAPYARYFLLPNAINYFFPPLEKLEVYNLGSSHVSEIAQQWFEYHSTEVSSISPHVQGNLLMFFPSLFVFVNIAFMGCVIYFLWTKGYRKTPRSFNLALILATLFFLGNMGFSILASPIVFRYQVFPMIILLTFGGMLVAFIDQHSKIQVEVQEGSEVSAVKKRVEVE